MSLLSVCISLDTNVNISRWHKTVCSESGPIRNWLRSQKLWKKESRLPYIISTAADLVATGYEMKDFVQKQASRSGTFHSPFLFIIPLFFPRLKLPKAKQQTEEERKNKQKKERKKKERKAIGPCMGCFSCPYIRHQ